MNIQNTSVISYMIIPPHNMFYTQVFLVVLALVALSYSDSTLPTNYEYYTSGGIKSGLSADQPYFILNGKNVTIYSGSIHYFRVPRAYWSDRIKKLRALGFNTVETYIAWNLHEPEQGTYDFGDGTSDMSDFLHLEEFIQLAQQNDLFMIIRAGPYICAEFDFGGFPSWMVRDEGIIFRNSNEVYLEHVRRWFGKLLPLLAKYQFTNGGPIVAFQVENEYAGAGKASYDRQYLPKLRQIFLDNGIVELLVTSDNPWRGTVGTLPEYFLMTGNFNVNGTGNFNYLEQWQPGKPKMAMELWSGWFDYIGVHHQTTKLDAFKQVYTDVLTYPGSANIYMFIGGTSFHLLSGAQIITTGYSPMTTSYDYDALLSENGDYTEKYYAAKELLAQYNQNPATYIPEMPELVARVAYPSLQVSQTIKISDFLSTLPNEVHANNIAMELLNVNNNNGQSYGYIVYSKDNLDIPKNSALTIMGQVSDIAIVLVNGQRVSQIIEKGADMEGFGTYKVVNSTLGLNNVNDLKNARLDIVVENLGRINTGVYRAFKGLWQGDIKLNDATLVDWTHSALEFKQNWISSLNLWSQVDNFKNVLEQPTLLKFNLAIEDDPKDTYLLMDNWTKGVVLVNGFLLGRYNKIGPQQALYLPAPFLKQGENEIVVFELYKGDGYLNFSTEQVFAVY